MRPATLLLTVPVVALLTQPLWAPQWGAGILTEVAALGPAGSAIAILLFFAAVALYCRELQRLLASVPPDARRRSPRSVWLMFAIPFNFVEDFFIVSELGASMRRDGRLAPERLRAWLALGHCWCILQIASLVPGPVGVASGVLALIAWLAHWGLTVAARRRLRFYS